MRHTLMSYVVMILAVLFGPAAITLGQATQPTSLEQRVAALEAENAKLRALVQLLSDRLNKVEAQAGTVGSQPKGEDQSAADEFLGTWKKTKGDYYFNGSLDRIIISKEGDNVFVRIDCKCDV
jgi:hypothetical protein